MFAKEYLYIENKWDFSENKFVFEQIVLFLCFLYVLYTIDDYLQVSYLQEC